MPNIGVGRLKAFGAVAHNLAAWGDWSQENGITDVL